MPKADKKCKTCEWWRDESCYADGFWETNEQVVDAKDDIFVTEHDYCCRFWSASLENAACKRCVYWGGIVPKRSDESYCHVTDDVVSTSAGWWCGDFVPRAE